MREPDWERIANLGDRSPLDYGGYFIYRDQANIYNEQAEYVEAPSETLEKGDPRERWTVYRFTLCCYRVVGDFLVPDAYDPDYWRQPVEAYDEWFHVHLQSVADSCGTTKDALVEALCSEDSLRRAWAFREIGAVLGFVELDSDPLTLTRPEVEARYPEFA